MSVPEANIRRELLDYLGGRLSAEERDSFEMRLLEDNAFSEAAEAARFDLLEEYAAGDLSAEERSRVEAWIAVSPEQRQYVRIAQGLHRSVSHGRQRPAGVSWRWWVPAAAACIALAISLPLLNRRGVPTPAPVKPADALAAPAALPPDTVLLVAERLRAGEATHPPLAAYTLHPDRPTRVQIMLPASSIESAYSIIVHAEASPPVSLPEFSDVHPQGNASARYLEITLPAKAMPAGRIVAEVRSATGVYRIPFRVTVTSK